jgi:hypothetical protein
MDRNQYRLKLISIVSLNEFRLNSNLMIASVTLFKPSLHHYSKHSNETKKWGPGPAGKPHHVSNLYFLKGPLNSAEWMCYLSPTKS